MGFEIPFCSRVPWTSAQQAKAAANTELGQALPVLGDFCGIS